MPAEPVLIAIDWGTTSFRAALLAGDGSILDRRTAAAGIMQVPDRDFAAVLACELDAWLARHPVLPVYASGMIGSRQGWVEVPYVPCPADLKTVAEGVVRHEVGGGAVRFVPGLSHLEPDGTPEVMRGEEVQVFGAIGPGEDALVILPGTHSKWVAVRQGRITAFATFMTGELYAALRQHTILGRLIEGEAHDAAAFARGVRHGFGTPALSHALFSARTLPLSGQLAESAVASYLSGLLIGAEFAGGRRVLGEVEDCRHVAVGDPRLTKLYAEAARALDLTLSAAAEDAACRGCLALARSRGDVTP
jgi:2-dehydro-3-deoxygalactonokinase